MKQEAQRIAIAEACGWLDIVPRHWSGHHKSYQALGHRSDERVGYYYGFIPDYLTDLNAMHEAEKVLKGEQRVVYIATLLPLTGTVQQDLWHTAHATAAQRAEAFLRTLNLWKP